MKEEVFYSKGMKYIKEDYPDLYEENVSLNKVAYTGKALDYKTQKLIALGINAAFSDDRAIKKQIMSNMQEFGTTKDEIVDVFRVVLLIAGKPAFMKAINILYELEDDECVCGGGVI
jgi:alkylhydroperoxidase/carboxymuconolactone decarboxylase family protein YurZ